MELLTANWNSQWQDYPYLTAANPSSESPGPLAWKPGVELTVPGDESSHLEPPKPHSSAASHSSIVDDHGNAKYLADSRPPRYAGNITGSLASRDECLTQIGSGLEGSGLEGSANRSQLNEADITDDRANLPRDELNWENVEEQYTQGRTLGESIRAALVVSQFTESENGFLPNNALDRIITRERVYQELSQDGFVRPEDLDNVTDNILKVTSPPTSKSSGKQTTRMKIFAILGLMERIGEIVHFIKGNLYDSDLPFTLSRGSRPGTLKLCCKNNDGSLRPIELFNSNKWIASDLEGFNTSQWRLLVPYFQLITDTNRKVFHYPLEDSTILPFKDNEVTRSARHAEGGYGEVWRIKIHPAHHNSCANSASPDENPSFAVKRLNHDSYKAFNDEVSSLKRFSEKDYVHLIKLLVTFSWHKKYYLLFPWADGNLLDFWKLYPQPSYPQRNQDLAIWFSDQCRGLVQGLKMIHIGDMPCTEKLPDMQKTQIHGRHGDLKPENILWFKSYKENTNEQFSGVMKISDFGLMRFHSTQSKSNVENVAVSRTYRPPEYDVARKVSQSYDVWALGCVLLQFVTWYLLGWDEIDNFSKERTRDDSRDYPEDVFFDFVTIKSEMGARFKLSVAEEFHKLNNHPNCSDFIADLLKFIEERLLRMDPNKRARCEEIVCEFAQFHQLCVSDEDYSLKRIRRPPRRTSTSLSELTAEKLALSQAQNDAIRKNRVPEHTGPVENGRQNSAANIQPLAKGLSANVQDDSDINEQTGLELKGKTLEKSSPVPKDRPIPENDCTTTAISEETRSSRPQSPKRPQSASKKAVHFDMERSQSQEFRQFELDQNLSSVSAQFPDDLPSLENTNNIFAISSYSTHIFNSPCSSPSSEARPKPMIHSVDSLDLSQLKQPDSVISTSYFEEHAPPIPSTSADNHDVEIHHLDSLQDINLQPIENPEVHNSHKVDGPPENDENASNGNNDSPLDAEPPLLPRIATPPQTQEQNHLPAEEERPPDQHSGSMVAHRRPLKAVKSFFYSLCCIPSC